MFVPSLLRYVKFLPYHIILVCSVKSKKSEFSPKNLLLTVKQNADMAEISHTILRAWIDTIFAWVAIVLLVGIAALSIFHSVKFNDNPFFR